jgi:hypothetical protein
MRREYEEEANRKAATAKPKREKRVAVAKKNIDTKAPANFAKIEGS